MYRFLFSELQCPNCVVHNLSLEENLFEKMGCAAQLVLKCSMCDYERGFQTSKKCGKGYEVNRRLVYSMRQCGVGYGGIKKWATFMNMPSTMCQTSYDKINILVKDAAKAFALKTMKDAAEVIHQNENSDVVDIGVSVDASWQRRGYCSLNGVTTAISVDTSKILDTHPQVKHCQKCALKMRLKKENIEAHNAWKCEHKCTINHVGSSGAMECEGAKAIFKRSVPNHKLRYTEFFGDGDSKSHPAVMNTYTGIDVKKQECIGHVQKRVGNRLRNLKKNVKNLGSVN